ncbi:HAD family hydrolase [uncultured Alistipes sp.]|uniref:HAD family hydrolase n=1 Tax=uncultured Alistipes sp. TaxID=538949 RepID=UPI0026200BE6|nr:HAD family hydrolase [uncultured Alistipes sp.]
MLELYRRGENVFEALNREHGLDVPITTYLSLYRTHRPRIALSPGIPALLTELKARRCGIGLVTDGRSVTQRNKIAALRLDTFLSPASVVISEEFGSSKPDCANFEYFHRLYPGCRFIYVADNPQKDFLAPNRLGWRTICLRDDGRNIHSQHFDLPTDYLPQTIAETTDQIISHLNI